MLTLLQPLPLQASSCVSVLMVKEVYRCPETSRHDDRDQCTDDLCISGIAKVARTAKAHLSSTRALAVAQGPWMLLRGEKRRCS